MSGVYINMEMPTNCEDCPMCHSNAEYDYAYCCVSSAETSGNKIPSNCPLVSIPAHGRLIDADEMIRELEITEEDDHNGATLLMAVFLEVLKSAPTIISATNKE